MAKKDKIDRDDAVDKPKQMRQVYVRSGEKVERMKKEGWKIAPIKPATNRFEKDVKATGDLTLMEREE